MDGVAICMDFEEQASAGVAPTRAPVAYLDLRGALSPSWPAGQVLTDPTGRRARRVALAGRCVSGLLGLWLVLLVLGGIGLIPVDGLPLGRFVASADPSPVRGEGAGGRAAKTPAASGAQARTALDVTGLRRRPSAAPSPSDGAGGGRAGGRDDRSTTRAHRTASGVPPRALGRAHPGTVDLRNTASTPSAGAPVPVPAPAPAPAPEQANAPAGGAPTPGAGSDVAPTAPEAAPSAPATAPGSGQVTGASGTAPGSGQATGAAPATGPPTDHPAGRGVAPGSGRSTGASGTAPGSGHVTGGGRGKKTAPDDQSP